MGVRKATTNDLSRIAEIYVFNNRVNYLPIFKDPNFSFGEMQVIPLVNNYFGKKEIMDNILVFDDGLIKGFVEIQGTEIRKLYVDTFFQSEGIGAQLIEYAIHEYHTDNVLALEKNVRAIAFYKRHGFKLTREKIFEEGTTEKLVKLVR